MPSDLSNDDAAARTAAALPMTAVSQAVAAARTAGIRPTTGVGDTTPLGDGVDPKMPNVQFAGTNAGDNQGNGQIDGSSARVRLLEAVSRATAETTPPTLREQLQHDFARQLDLQDRQQPRGTAVEALEDARNRVNRGQPGPVMRRPS